MTVVSFLLTMVVGLVAVTKTAMASPPPDIYAVVIGYNGGAPGLPDLHYADDDAVRFAMFFSGLIPQGRPGRVWLLTDIDADTRGGLDRAGLSVTTHAQPTRQALFSTLAAVTRELADRPHDRPRVLYVVYAGHGLHGRILLRPEAATEAAITGGELRAALADVIAADPTLQTFLFVDACRSESLFSDRGNTGPDFSAAISDLERRAKAVNLGILTAAQTGKPAGEIRALQAGYFSHVLTSGLAGAADADGDDVVTFGELAAFVAFNTQKLTGQIPWFDPPGGDLSARAIDHRGQRPRLLLSSSDPGRYLVVSEAGRPVFAEAWKDLHRPLRLVLPSGHYRVLRVRNQKRTLSATVELRANETLDLATASFVDAPANSVDMRGDPPLAPDDGPGFSAAFSDDVVSTLAAGYHAGREPSRDRTAASNRLTLTAGVGPAPLDLAGAESSLALRYQRQGRHLFWGVSARGATSAHRLQDDAYALRRLSVLFDGGLAHPVSDLVTLQAGFGVGMASTLRTGSGETRGDPLGLILAAGLGLDLHIFSPWFVSARFHYIGHWVTVSGDRRRSLNPVIDLGAGLWF